MIEKNINRNHFNEKKLEGFFEKCWELKEPRKFKENERFFKFLYEDLKVILQCVENPKYLVEFTKFVVFFGADDDPEIFDILLDAILRQLRYLNVDDILTTSVNFAHTLTPHAQDLFNSVN
jgi:hypothetical protein